MDIRAYWKRVRAIQNELEQNHGTGPIYLSTLEWEDTQLAAGAISVTHAELAARLICNGRHALATEQQIADYKAEQQRRGQLISATERYWARERKEPNERGGVNYAV